MRRRTFIGLGVAAAAGAGLGYWFRDWLVGRRPQPLSPQETLDAMTAMVESVLGRPFFPGTASPSIEPYRSLFQWRFENLSGDRRSQEGFARLLDQLARERAGSAFAECEGSTRRLILETALETPGGREAGIFLTGLIVQLFARTDVYPLLGYAAPLGVPRGLELYTKSPTP